jgi:hypothetical protein
MIERRFPAHWLLFAGLFHLVPAAVQAALPPAADDDRMAAIVADVRAEETKYRGKCPLAKREALEVAGPLRPDRGPQLLGRVVRRK